MRRLRSIFKKEIKEIFANRSAVVVSAAVSLFVGTMYALQSAMADPSPQPANPTFILSTIVGLLISYTFASQVFYREKVSGTIETLLCSPISLRMLWAGKVIAVEPYLGHKLQGLKSLKEAYVPGIFDKRWVDEKVNIADDDAFEMCRVAAKAEGLLVGMSSGATLVAALDLAKRLKEGVVVVVLPDFGERYLSTDLFTA